MKILKSFSTNGKEIQAVNSTIPFNIISGTLKENFSRSGGFVVTVPGVYLLTFTINELCRAESTIFLLKNMEVACKGVDHAGELDEISHLSVGLGWNIRLSGASARLNKYCNCAYAPTARSF